MGHMYFVRHGQTVWNVENKICGSTDIDLTEKGHEQRHQDRRPDSVVRGQENSFREYKSRYHPLFSAYESRKNRKAHFGNHGNSCKSRAEIDRTKLWKI